MPKNEPDRTDPLELTRVEVPAKKQEVESMARGFAEEFAACGWDENRLFAMFSNPFYAGPHLAFRQLGEARIREVITDAMRPWGDRHA